MKNKHNWRKSLILPLILLLPTNLSAHEKVTYSRANSNQTISNSNQKKAKVGESFHVDDENKVDFMNRTKKVLQKYSKVIISTVVILTSISFGGYASYQFFWKKKRKKNNNKTNSSHDNESSIVNNGTSLINKSNVNSASQSSIVNNDTSLITQTNGRQSSIVNNGTSLISQTSGRQSSIVNNGKAPINKSNGNSASQSSVVNNDTSLINQTNSSQSSIVNNGTNLINQTNSSQSSIVNNGTNLINQTNGRQSSIVNNDTSLITQTNTNNDSGAKEVSSDEAQELDKYLQDNRSSTLYTGDGPIRDFQKAAHNYLVQKKLESLERPLEDQDLVSKEVDNVDHEDPLLKQLEDLESSVENGGGVRNLKQAKRLKKIKNSLSNAMKELKVAIQKIKKMSLTDFMLALTSTSEDNNMFMLSSQSLLTQLVEKGDKDMLDFIYEDLETKDHNFQFNHDTKKVIVNSAILQESDQADDTTTELAPAFELLKKLMPDLHKNLLAAPDQSEYIEILEGAILNAAERIVNFLFTNSSLKQLTKKDNIFKNAYDCYQHTKSFLNYYNKASDTQEELLVNKDELVKRLPITKRILEKVIKRQLNLTDEQVKQLDLKNPDELLEQAKKVNETDQSPQGLLLLKIKEVYHSKAV